MVKKPTSGDSEQRERDSERARRASELAPSQHEHQDKSRSKPRPYRARSTPSNGGPEEESAHGALPREGIDSD
jgi:hypothetical protein